MFQTGRNEFKDNFKFNYDVHVNTANKCILVHSIVPEHQTFLFGLYLKQNYYAIIFQKSVVPFLVSTKMTSPIL